MASTYSTNLAIELIGTGDQAGAWGNTTNTNLGTLIEQAISGYVTQAVATGTDTSITIPSGATGVARNMYIELTGTGGTNTNLIVPANKKLYFIFNNSTGAVTVKVAGQTGVSVPTGKKMVLVSDGTDIVNGLNYIADFGTNSFTVTNLTATSATITNLVATTASATTLTATSSNITTLSGTNFSATSLTLTNALGVAQGGTGSSLTPSNGQLLVGNGTNFTLNTLNGGPGVGITNAAGSITITATGTGFIASVNATSPLQSVGTQSITISLASAVPISLGGTGQTSAPANGRLLIGNGTSFVLSNLTAGTGVTITNGAGSITISTTSALVGTTSANLTTLGVNAGDSVTSGTYNTAIGYDAGTALTTGGVNTAVGAFAVSTASTTSYLTGVGYNAIKFPTGANNTALGAFALQGASGSAATRNVAVGSYALEVITSGTDNTAVGNLAGDSITTGIENTLVGATAGYGITTAQRNTLIGYGAGDVVNTGSYNSFVGRWAGIDISTGNYNSALGELALGTSFINPSNCTGLGAGSQVTGSDQVQLGNGATTTYAYGAVQNRSDARDKADITDTDLGLDFVMALRPRKFRWDMREDYRTPRPPPGSPQSVIDAWKEANMMSAITANGTHKRNRFHQGLIAQEVKVVMDSMGVDFGGYQDHKIKGGEDVFSIGYGEMIAPLIKAIQELKAEFDEYKRTHP